MIGTANPPSWLRTLPTVRMRRVSAFATLLVSLLLGASLAWGQGSYTLEPTGAPPASEVAKAVLDALQPQGIRLLGEKGAAVSEVWLSRSVLLTQASAGSGDAVYPSLGVGTLLGVLHFPSAGADFRGQAIKPGYYTLRYAHIPKDGNHMGVNPYPDFVLLSPAAVDTQTESLKLEDLLTLSRQASGTAHPAVMSLVPIKGASFPSLVQDGQGHWVLQVKLSGRAAANGQVQALPIALVLLGQAQGA